MLQCLCNTKTKRFRQLENYIWTDSIGGLIYADHTDELMFDYLIPFVLPIEYTKRVM